MRKTNTIEHRTVKHPKGLGWYAVEITNGLETWRSSNFATVDLCEERIKQRQNLKALTQAQLNKANKKSEKVSPLSVEGRVLKRVKKTYVRYINKFDEYAKVRANQSNAEHQEWFVLQDIHKIFGLYPTAVKRLVENGSLTPPAHDDSTKYRTSWTFKFEQLEEMAKRFKEQIN